MSKEESNKREKHIRSNFASIFLLMSALVTSALIGFVCLVIWM